ncbi:MAG: S41 family peptidase [Saprospiraceae bacterium]
MQYKLLLFFTSGLMFLSSCQKPTIAQEVNTPINNFELLWKDFDQYYGMFAVKGIDWDSMYAVYRPQVNDQMTEQEFYTVITQLLTPLQDNHVSLIPTNSNLPRWSNDLENGLPKYDHLWSLDLLKSKYLKGFREFGPIGYGWMQSRNIGYLHLSGFDGSSKEYAAVLDEAFAAFKNAEGLVLDIRDCPGGFDPTAQYVAGRFAKQRALYMSTRKRNGPRHTDFTEKTEWYVLPTGSSQFTKPITLLTTRFTQSAGETFTLAMQTLDHVTIVGDTTSGAFSDNIYRDLYNGWMFSISVGDYRAADGRSYEGIGIAPDVRSINTRANVLNGQDQVLEKALEIMQ